MNGEPEVFLENENSMDSPINLEFYNDELYIANWFSENILKTNVDITPFNLENILNLNGVYDLIIDDGILYYSNVSSIYRIELASLSVDDVSLNKIKIYPSPTKSEINITNLHTAKSYILYDVLGRIMKYGTLKSHGNVNVSNLEAGYYFIKIEDYKDTLKFLKI